MALPAYAEYFCSVTDTNQIQQALVFAADKDLPITPMGGGSNMVIAGDIQGLVLHLDLKGISSKPVADNQVEVTFAAGENWHEMVQYCLQQGWYGLENLSLIPGNMGAAPIQNIGAYGVELCDLFVSLQAIGISTGEL
ncbi:MAG: FAD-binding protein, partial [Porticoccaceae bacterium]